MKSLKYIAAIAIACASIGLAPKASALTFGDANDLGQVLNGIPSGDAFRTIYVNHLIAMAPGTTDTADGQTYVRSTNNPGPGFPNYTTAVFAHNGTGTSIDLGDGTLYCYLFAKYDGPNAGSEVWYVGDLSGVITIPATGLAGQNYGLSGWTLFSCDNGGGRVPEGGSTIALLGLALAGVELLRRKVLSRRAVKV
jgi:VPDSG-CTERM motif